MGLTRKTCVEKDKCTQVYGQRQRGRGRTGSSRLMEVMLKLILDKRSDELWTKLY
jgi:hypothetical protein